MKRFLSGMFVVACAALLSACSMQLGSKAAELQPTAPVKAAAPVKNAGIIPAPAKYELGQGAYTFGWKSQIRAAEDAMATAKVLRDGLKQRGIEIGISRFKLKNPSAGSIVLEISASASKNPEGYTMVVDPKTVMISARSDAGLFYGVQSLLQMIDAQAPARGKRVSVPAVRIEDEPRFGYRGFMLDESRHFFGKETVEQYLDMMAYLKLNRFHWHLTDSPGWRIEIKKYPKLTEVGGIGNHSDDKAPAKFYTQAEIKEIVAYAAARHITIIPEIDMPGHASAATRAYPEISGGGSARYPGFTFNPGKEETYRFLEDILTEVAQLFPGPYIHLGGDEVSFGNQEWKTKPEIQKFMADHGMKDEVELEHYFVKRMAGVIQKLGKKTMGWDEITSSNVPRDSVVFWWRHNKRLLLRQAVQEGYPVVMCPRSPMYFDFIQMEGQEVGRKPMFNDMASVYNFPDPYITSLVPAGMESQVIGIQACLWTESIASKQRADYMTFPRMAGLAEDAWTPTASKNFDDFMSRLPSFLRVLKARGIHYFDPFNPASTPEPAGPVRVQKPLS